MPRPVLKHEMYCPWAQDVYINLERMVYKVHNLREGNRDGNWIRNWEKATGQKAGLCHRVGCFAHAEDGAHIQLSDPNNRKWYIVPLCHKCNCQFGAEFNVAGPLVSITDPNDILW